MFHTKQNSWLVWQHHHTVGFVQHFVFFMSMTASFFNQTDTAHFQNCVLDKPVLNEWIRTGQQVVCHIILCTVRATVYCIIIMNLLTEKEKWHSDFCMYILYYSIYPICIIFRWSSFMTSALWDHATEGSSTAYGRSSEIKVLMDQYKRMY